MLLAIALRVKARTNRPAPQYTSGSSQILGLWVSRPPGPQSLGWSSAAGTFEKFWGPSYLRNCTGSCTGILWGFRPWWPIPIRSASIPLAPLAQVLQATPPAPTPGSWQEHRPGWQAAHAGWHSQYTLVHIGLAWLAGWLLAGNRLFIQKQRRGY